MINVQARHLGLTHARDIDEAMSLADELGPLVADVICDLNFPGPWVLGKSVESVEIATWAVAHCNDPDSLDEIAQQSRLRAAVRKALIDNPATRHSTVQVLKGEVPSLGEVAAAKKALRSKARALLSLRSYGKRTTQREAITALDRLIKNGDTQYVDRVYTHVASLGFVWMAEGLLTYRYLPDTLGAMEQRVYAECRLTTTEALEKFKGSTGRNVAVGVVRKIMLGDAAPTTKVDMELFSFAEKSGFPRSSKPVMDHRLWMEESVIDRAKSSEVWAQVLDLSVLLETEVTEMFESTTGWAPGACAQLINSEADYKWVPLLLRSLERETYLMGDTESIGHILTAVEIEGSRELYEKLLAHLSNDDMSLALSGNLRYCRNGKYTSYVLPDEWVDDFIAQLVLLSKEADEPISPGYVFEAMSQLPVRHATKLLLQIPGVAAGLTPDTRLYRSWPGQLVYESLRDVGPSLDVAFGLLYEHPELSLAEVIALCQALQGGQSRLDSRAPA
jgi:hypothetical protein